MRTALFVLAALLATALPAHANAPPVVSATATPWEAVLFEPVVFQDTSTDPDGTIVRAVWSFSDDGRDVVGRTVTRAFSFAAVHSVILHVTDDAGATVRHDLQVVVRAPVMHGRAVAIDAGAASAADTGEVARSGQSATTAAVGEARHGQLRAFGLEGEVRTYDGPARAVSTATVGSLYIPSPTGYFLLTGIESHIVNGCGMEPIHRVRFTQVRHNDSPILPPGSVAPNTLVTVGGLSLVLNAESVDEDGTIGLSAVRILAPGAPPVDVARVVAGVAVCPYSG